MTRSRSPKARSGRKLAAKAPKKWPGCFVAHRDARWILGVEDLATSGLTGNNLPDMSIDPDSKVLSVVNSTDTDRVFFLSLSANVGCMGSSGQRLVPGVARGDTGVEHATIAFVLLVGPQQVMDVCELADVDDVEKVDIHSDIVDLVPCPSWLLDAEYGDRVYAFPLGGHGPFLCSQSSGGRLTHFAHPSTYHAIDLDCPVGSPVLAIADGTIVSVKQSEKVTGIDVANFFRWNHVVVRHHDGPIVEFVHIQTDSVCVREGDRVLRGQRLCLSGEVGFSPRPHLHLEMHLEDGKGAPSVPFAFVGEQGPFRCVEGERYTAAGIAKTSGAATGGP